MKLPSKSVSYDKSVFSLFPEILSLLREKHLTVAVLRSQMQNCSIDDFVAAMDCLYAMGKIDFNRENGELSYVDAD